MNRAIAFMAILAALVINGCNASGKPASEERPTPRQDKAEITCVGSELPFYRFSSSEIEDAEPVDMKSNGPAVGALRSFLKLEAVKAEDVPAEGWFVFSDEANLVVFGLRGRNTPIARVIAVAPSSDRDGRWIVQSSQPCWPAESNEGVNVATLYLPRDSHLRKGDRVVRIQAVIKECTRAPVVIRTKETSRTVWISATYKAPSAGGDGPCKLVDRSDFIDVPLASPLGDREIVQEDFVHSRPLTEFDRGMVFPALR